jgi:GDP-L-fucose synthase
MNDLGRVFVAGHNGLVGRALVRRLSAEPGSQLILRARTHLDLTVQAKVNDFFASERPEVVFLAAARVGGIMDNSRHPADFVRENLLIQTNVIDAAWRHGVRKLLFLGSSCIYPRLAPQPLRPEYLLTGELEETNRAYAIAKLAGIETCRGYRSQYSFDAISALPTNLYGPWDNFDPERSHVIPALIRRFVAAVSGGDEVVRLWGSGQPRREFLHVDDLAEALVTLVRGYSGEVPVNVGTGVDITIAELAAIIANQTGFRGRIEFDPTYPDGTPRKVLDVSAILSMGWRPSVDLVDGLRQTIEWFLSRERTR